FADNVRGLISVADSCGREWGRIARDAVVFLSEREKAERPHVTIVRHGLAIFEALELDQISSVRFNKELRRLDLPDAKWTHYRGPKGADYPHPLEIHQQAGLLVKVDVHSVRIRPPGGERCRGYKVAQFREAWRKHGTPTPGEAKPARGRLRLIA